MWMSLPARVWEPGRRENRRATAAAGYKAGKRGLRRAEQYGGVPVTDQGGAGQPPAPGTSLKIDEEPSGSCLVFHVRGDVDFETADRLRDRVLTAAKGADPPRLVLDLAQVVYCDSSCMSALVAIWKAVNAADGAVILAE